MTTVTLPSDYYLTNFNKLRLHATSYYSDLLSEDEKLWLSRFENLETTAQCLLVRLLTRKGKWFRSDKLNYVEIPATDKVLSQLQKEGFVELNPQIDHASIAESLLTKNEVGLLFPNLDKKLRKPQLVEAIANDSLTPLSEYPFDIVYLQSSRYLKLLSTLFFANTRQDLTQFVLSDIGMHNFEQYELSKELRFFKTRNQIDALIKIFDIWESFEANKKVEKIQVIQWLSSIPKQVKHNYVDAKLQTLTCALARQLERIGDIETALLWFRKTPALPSRERQVRILEKLKRYQEMGAMVAKMLSHPINKGEYEVALKLHDRFRRVNGEKVQRREKPKHESVLLKLDIETQRVELAVAEHYNRLGYQVYYTENSLLNGLMVLTLWPAIFAPIEGAFVNSYQAAPKDLYQPSFVSSRADLIEKELSDLLKYGLKHLLDRYRRKAGIENPFLHWKYLPLECVENAVNNISPQLLVDLIRIQLSDLKLYRSGMPDLIAFKGQQFKWIEVKGPGDTLQDNQIRWFHHFNELGIDYCVAWVNAE
ncbi:VRR-NUC domain-containing protein [Vibrio sonorensis]|uniref:VRR-NUC domain-containing protein n=1 Tax=Vibrio sonorensis TaxID=1004316 RepID=UPI0008D9F02E|nr:VRR-NUC domain-containing protein [Vibrio sonorensis]